MRPRFSIRTLLGITAYFAVNIAAYVQPLSSYPLVAFLFGAGALIGIVVIAVGRNSGQVLFCRSFLCVLLLYNVLRVWEPVYDYSKLDWPTEYFIGRPVVITIPMSDDDRSTVQRRVALARQNTSLLVGALGGCLVLWRHRVLERQAKKGAE